MLRVKVIYLQYQPIKIKLTARIGDCQGAVESHI